MRCPAWWKTRGAALTLAPRRPGKGYAAMPVMCTRGARGRGPARDVPRPLLAEEHASPFRLARKGILALARDL